MAKIYIIRHGESESNLRSVFAGQHNSPLTKLGRKQALSAASKIDKAPDKIISSNLARSLDTAVIVAKELGFDPGKIETDTRLSEFNVGILLGKSKSDVNSEELLGAEQSESITNFVRRLKSLLNENSNYEGTILLFSHGGVMRLYRSLMEGLEPKDFYDLPTPKNCEILELDAKRILNSSK
jgi:probable phosphoglycerate mutase